MAADTLPAPFNFYKLLLDGDAMHFGYWPDDHTDLSLEQAQTALTDLLLTRLPRQDKRKILDVGCGLGATSGLLAQHGHQVTALAPSTALIAYAEHHHPGPRYLACGLLDDAPELALSQHYDVIILQESLQYLADLDAVFSTLKNLLKPQTGRIILCDEVSYDSATRQQSAVHLARDIEQAFSAQGFYVAFHQKIGDKVLPTCRESVKRFTARRTDLIAQCGESVQDLLSHYAAGWTFQDHAYRSGQMGYEIWDLRPSHFCVRGYRAGDETHILETFNRVFACNRSLAHWQWKYRDNPFGRYFIGTAWKNDELVAQYAGYPVPLWFEQTLQTTCQGADVFTVPAYRGVGRGATNLFSRAFRYFNRSYYEQRIPFAYGFNTGTAQRLGKLFMAHHFPAQVYEWTLQQPVLAYHPLRNALTGYRVQHSRDVGAWADSIFATAKYQYAAMIARSAEYLHWRYVQHPDFDYDFFVIYRFGKPVGWWAGKYENNQFLLGDGVFINNAHVDVAMRIGLAAIAHHFKGLDGIRGWFSMTPDWWVKLLKKLGFQAHPQADNLAFGIHLVNETLSPQDIGENFYFTWGDSDLF
jgi:cyclopropane fatty-acyl-phospholipid synthase-like methyltransferase